MKNRQTPDTGLVTSLVAVVVVLGIIVALAWSWSSGHGAAVLTRFGLLPAQVASASQAPPPAGQSQLASGAPPPESPSAPELLPESEPQLSESPDSTSLVGDPGADGTLIIANDDAGFVTGTIESAGLSTITEVDVRQTRSSDQFAESADPELSADPVVVADLAAEIEDGVAQPKDITYPLPAQTAELSVPPGNIAPEVEALLPAQTAASLLLGPGFARNFVATVDNLGRSFAPASRWPVSPTSGRFEFMERDGRTYIAPENHRRYASFVRLVETLDVPSMVDLYVRAYPQLQDAYAELGFPDAYFNDRLVEVVDLLLASPELDSPPEVTYTEVPNRKTPAIKPWTNYQFADPDLDALPAGQKIMIRVGPDNQRRLKTKLAELRQELLTRVLPGRAAP